VAAGALKQTQEEEQRREEGQRGEEERSGQAKWGREVEVGHRRSDMRLIALVNPPGCQPPLPPAMEPLKPQPHSATLRPPQHAADHPGCTVKGLSLCRYGERKRGHGSAGEKKAKSSRKRQTCYADLLVPFLLNEVI
jgi:hypothetical protein